MIVKCLFCGKRDTDKKDMERVEFSWIPAARRGNYHKECVQKLCDSVSIIAEEKAIKKELNELLIKLHRTNHMPSWFWIVLSDLRQGKRSNVKYGLVDMATPKKPVRYEVIIEAYKMAYSAIEYAIGQGKFSSPDAHIKWGYKAMHSKINDAYRKLYMNNKAKANEEGTMEVAVKSEQRQERIQYKKKKNDKVDISDFLD